MPARTWRSGPLIRCWWECKAVQPLWKTAWQFLKKTKYTLSIGSNNAAPWHLAQRNANVCPHNLDMHSYNSRICKKWTPAPQQVHSWTNCGTATPRSTRQQRKGTDSGHAPQLGWISRAICWVKTTKPVLKGHIMYNSICTTCAKWLNDRHGEQMTLPEAGNGWGRWVSVTIS